MKQMNRKLELSYRRAEFLTAWLSESGQWYGREELNDGWKIILRNQFHDIIPGSSIHEVYEDAREEYKEAREIVQNLESSIIENNMVKNDRSVVLVNAAGSFGKRNVTVPSIHGVKEGIWKNSNGDILPQQKQNNGWMIEVNNLPSFGAMNLYFEENTVPEKKSNFSYQNQKLETQYYTVEWNEYGQITYLFDKQANRQVLSSGQKGNVLQIFEDKPLAHDAWDIDIFYQEKMEEIRHLDVFEVVENDELSFAIHAKWSYHHSDISQHIVFYHNDRRIDFETTVNWHEKRKLLKSAFPVDIRATEATYDIQFGNVKRPTHWNTSWDMAKFETVGHQWADLSEPDYGVSLLNDSKYGYDIKENTMRITLLKAAIHPDPHADQGTHSFVYSLYPHIGDWREARIVEKAYDLNDPVKVFAGTETKEASFLEVDANHVWVDAIKPAYDGNGMIIRLHEYEGRRGNVTLNVLKNNSSWVETDLMEEPIGEYAVSPIKFDIKPYEIKTIRIL